MGFLGALPSNMAIDEDAWLASAQNLIQLPQDFHAGRVHHSW
jgi:hypothetical protein